MGHQTKRKKKYKDNSTTRTITVNKDEENEYNIEIKPENLRKLVKEGFAINNSILSLKRFFLKNANKYKDDLEAGSDTYIYNHLEYDTEKVNFASLDKNNPEWGDIINRIKKTESSGSTDTKCDPTEMVCKYNYDITECVMNALDSLNDTEEQKKPNKFILLVLCRLEKELKYCSSAMKTIKFASEVSASNIKSEKEVSSDPLHLGHIPLQGCSPLKHDFLKADRAPPITGGGHFDDYFD